MSVIGYDIFHNVVEAVHVSATYRNTFKVNLSQPVKTSFNNARFEIVMAVKIQIEVFWLVMKCSVLVGQQC